MSAFDKDIITALRYQVMVQNKEIMDLKRERRELRLYIRGLGEKTPHDWLKDEVREILGE